MDTATASALAADKTTLYSRIGGEAAVEAAVDIFYNRIVGDTQLAHFFEGIDMKIQRRKQAAFMTYIFGGAGAYKGRDLFAAHKGLIEQKGMNEGHFDRVAAHLQETLSHLNVPEELIAEVLTIVAGAKPVIFGRV